jgi:PIN domain nuclease of toxin-antitoxin system
MTLLLDTHAFLWWVEDPARLSVPARKAIRDASNPVFVSAVVVWEIVVKKSLGKLSAPDDLEGIINASRFQSLPMTVPHALAVTSLPKHHRDPFDRMLIAQAVHEGFRLVSRDPEIAKYPVSLLTA